MSQVDKVKVFFFKLQGASTGNPPLILKNNVKKHVKK